MATIDFYTNPMSRGQIVRWMLEELGEGYTEHLIEYGPQMHGPDYLAINPMGKVPAIRHDGRVVTEAAAICTYLADVFAEKDLGPRPEEKADYYRWMFFAAGPIEAAVTAKSMGWELPSPEKEGMAGFGSFDRTISTLEKALEGKNFIAGERFTAADVYVGSQIDFGMMFGSLESKPVFDDYTARFRERPAYRKAKARDNELIAAQQGNAS